MAIQQQAGAELSPRLRNQPSQRGMERLPALSDTPLRLAEGKPPMVDGLARGDDARDRSEPCAHAWAGAVHPVGQGGIEHARVQFPRFTVRIAPGAWEVG